MHPYVTQVQSIQARPEAQGFTLVPGLRIVWKWMGRAPACSQLGPLFQLQMAAIRVFNRRRNDNYERYEIKVRVGKWRVFVE